MSGVAGPPDTDVERLCSYTALYCVGSPGVLCAVMYHLLQITAGENYHKIKYIQRCFTFTFQHF